MAAGTGDGMVGIWNVTTHAFGWPLAADKGSVSRVAFSPDGQTLASGNSDGAVILWDLAATNAALVSPLGDLAATNVALVSPLGEHKGIITGVTFSPDGRIVASGDIDGSVILWDTALRTKLASFQSERLRRRLEPCIQPRRTDSSLGKRRWLAGFLGRRAGHPYRLAYWRPLKHGL